MENASTGHSWNVAGGYKQFRQAHISSRLENVRAIDAADWTVAITAGLNPGG